MDPECDIIRAELPEVEAIINNECWLEGERRGQPVDRSDAAIQKRVAEIILGGVGADLRLKHGK